MDVQVILPNGDCTLKEINELTTCNCLIEIIADELDMDPIRMQLEFDQLVLKKNTILTSVGIGPNDEIFLKPNGEVIVSDVLRRCPPTVHESDWNSFTANNEQFAIIAVRNCPENYSRISDRLKCDVEFSYTITSSGQYNLLSPQMKSNKIVALRAACYCFEDNWELIPDTLKKNRKFMKSVATKAWRPFCHASFPTDTYILTAYLKSARSTNCVAHLVKADHTAVLNSCTSCPAVVNVFTTSEILEDATLRSLIIKCLVRNPRCWNHLSNYLKNDEQFVQEVADSGGMCDGY